MIRSLTEPTFTSSPDADVMRPPRGSVADTPVGSVAQGSGP
jgi:hypothetical protein